MPRRLARLAAAFLPLLLAGARAAACPACAGSSAEGPSIWPIVGAFLLVPPFLAVAVIGAMRHEIRVAGAMESEPRSATSRRLARILAFPRPGR